MQTSWGAAQGCMHTTATSARHARVNAIVALVQLTLLLFLSVLYSALRMPLANRRL